MKKLNKKGFTLVELLAVIVILALLIVVVANTALPAMDKAKRKTLQTYTMRVMEQAKALYMSDNTSCESTACTLTQIMGADAPTDKYSASITVAYNNTTASYELTGTVQDIKNKLTATIGEVDGKKNQITIAPTS